MIADDCHIQHTSSGISKAHTHSFSAPSDCCHAGTLCKDSASVEEHAGCHCVTALAKKMLLSDAVRGVKKGRVYFSDRVVPDRPIQKIGRSELLRNRYKCRTVGINF